MAAPTAHKHSDLLSDVDQWDQPAPACADLMAVLGGGVITNSNDACRAVVNLATRSPVAIAFVIEGDDDHVHVGHSPTLFPQDITQASPFDNSMVVFVGDKTDSAVPVVLASGAFARTPVTRACDVATIVGATGHGAAPPLFRTGPHGTGTANTAELRVRFATLFPCQHAGDAVSTHEDGRCTLLSFCNTWVAPFVAHADADVVALWEPTRDWWRMASTNIATGDSAAGVDPIQSNVPIHNQRLNTWVSRQRAAMLARLGIGGPGLTTAAFTRGVQDIRDTLEANQTTALDYDRQKSNKTFSDKHGDALCARVMRYSNVLREEDIPEVHALLVKTTKSRECGIVDSMLAERAVASMVPLTAANAPKVTPRLLDDVFRCFKPGGTGLIFGQGLSPFAIICEGHKEMAEIARYVKKASTVESGAAVSLADADSITSHDVRFPTDAYVAAEKLCGWSVVIDVFHGSAHAVSISVRNAVLAIVPCLHRVSTQMADTPALGMDLVCRVMCELQQDYFQCLTKLEQTAGPAPAVPDFEHVIQKVLTCRANSLSPLPSQWHTLVDAPRSVPSASPPASGASPRQQSGTVTAHNADADRRLLARCRDSEHTTVTSMIGSHDVTLPKVNGEPVCLSWALKGVCSSGCKRKHQHVRYGRSTIQQLHKLMDDCGVANPQP
jgi:hypothetical protein